MQHGSSTFDILDLKIRVPPHLTSKFNNTNGNNTYHSFHTPATIITSQSAVTGSNSSYNNNGCNPKNLYSTYHHINNEPIVNNQQQQVIDMKIQEEEQEQSFLQSSRSKTENKSMMLQMKKYRYYNNPTFWLPMKIFTVLAIAFCLGPLFWIVSFHSENNKPELINQRAQQSACFFLIFSPFTLPILVTIQACNVHGRWFTFLLAWSSLALGNTSAVLYCASNSSYTWLRMWLLSAAMIMAVIQNLLLVYKGNVILLMISTASGVLVFCLALVAPFLPSLSMTYRCFESMVFPMLWLCWQASLGTTTTTTTTNKSNTSILLDKTITTNNSTQSSVSTTPYHVSSSTATHCHAV